MLLLPGAGLAPNCPGTHVTYDTFLFGYAKHNEKQCKSFPNVCVRACIYVRERQVSDNQMILLSMKAEDFGEYVCTASNAYGRATGSILLLRGGTLSG